MAHELKIEDSGRVMKCLGEAKERIAKVSWAIETCSGIGSMDLAIGGLNKNFVVLDTLLQSTNDAINVFNSVEEDLVHQLKVFAERNEDITF